MKVNKIVQRCQSSNSSLLYNNRIAKHLINLFLILIILAGNVFFPRSGVSANTDKNLNFLQDHLLESTPIERSSDFENNNIPFAIQKGRTAAQYLDIDSPATLWLADYTSRTAVYSKDGTVFNASAQIDGTSQIRAIASVPGDKRTAYYLTEPNKLWKTMDGGHSFTELTELSLLLPVCGNYGAFKDVFVNPSSPQEVFAFWTCDENTNNATHKGALYRSVDGGLSWVKLPNIGQAGQDYVINARNSNGRALMNVDGTIMLIAEGSIWGG